jgi:hypothetical protein
MIQMLTFYCKSNYGYSIRKKETHNSWLRLLDPFRIILPIGIFWLSATPSIVALLTIVSIAHIIPLASELNTLIWLILIRSSVSLFSWPTALFLWYRWLYRINITVYRPLTRSRHRINIGGIGLSVCLH